MSGGSGDRYYTQGAPTRTGSNNRGISSNRGLGSATSPRGYHGAQPPLGVGARLLGSPGRNTSSSLVQQRAALPKPDGNLCSYSLYECNTERLTGYEFCLRHILCDKNAPYKPCGYCGDSQSGLKCSRPAPCFNRGDSYCAQHTRVILAARQRSSKKRKSTPIILLESLASYKKSKVDNKTPADESTSSLPALNPFQQRFDPEAEGLGLAALESDGLQFESEDMLIRDTYTGGGDGESEGESVDSEGEDSLQLAGVYTVEEVMRILKDKLVKLQKLYIDQFQRLVFKMKESRREYLVQLKEEKDAGLVNISDQPNKDLEYERLKAMMHYFCPSGREALLSTKHRDKRLSLSGSSSKQTSFCQHTLTTTTKCNGVCVPMAKFCQKHILEEQGQVLYRACGVVTPADGPCETPVAALFSHTTCVFHTKIPVFNPSVHTDGEESNDKPAEPTEDDVSVKPVNKEDYISDVTNNTIQNNHDQKLKQETGLDPITPDLKNSNLGKQSEFLTKPQVEESKLQLAVSNDTIIKKEVNGEVIEKMDVDLKDESKSVVLTDDRIVKKESESEQTLLTKENPIKKTVNNEKVKEQHLDMSENKIVEANNQHDNRTDIDMKDGFVDPGKNSKSEDIKGKMSDKELDGKNHEMDIEETDNKADVSESNDDQASIVEAKVEDEEKSNKKSSKEKEIEESIKNDSSSIEKKDKSIEEENKVTEKSNEVIEKTDEVTVETDDITQKLEGVPDKSDEVTEKSDEVTEESDEVKEKSDEVTEKSEEVTEKSQEAKEKIDEVKVKTADIAKKTNEETAKSDKLIVQADEVTEITDEVTEITDEVTEITDEVADKSDEVTDKSDKRTVQADEVSEKTDGVAKKTDEEAAKSDKLTVQADEVTYVTDEATEITDEVTEITDEVAKKTDEETAKSDKLKVQADEVTYVTDEVTEITDEVAKKTDEMAKKTDDVAKKTEEEAEESNVDTSKSVI